MWSSTRPLVLILVLATWATLEASAKVATCRTRFKKDMDSDYCTKFGAGPYDMMKVQFHSRFSNPKNLAPQEGIEHVTLTVGVFTDQKYDELNAMDKPTCKQRMEKATRILNLVVPVDGRSSAEYDHVTNRQKAQVKTTARPRIYYFEVLDCEN